MELMVHVGYALTLCALLARDVLVLRATLVVGQSVLAGYAFSIGVFPMVGWNTVFVAINIVWVTVIVLERRRVKIPRELEPIYRRHFAAMQPREFLAWWRRGHREVLEGAPLTRSGVQPASLDFILAGTVRISRHGALVADLGPGAMVGEMSLVTGEPANADADAVGRVELQRWPRSDLADVRSRDLAMWTKILSAIGVDLVDKIRRGEAQGPP